MRHLMRSAHQRRQRRELNRVINSASPAMQQELAVAWQRQLTR
jgi:RNA polymerase-interacting CarD/CdnL/TRCF family regulator